jgi:hypothetical protein
VLNVQTILALFRFGLVKSLVDLVALVLILDKVSKEVRVMGIFFKMLLWFLFLFDMVFRLSLKIGHINACKKVVDRQ